MGADCDKNLSKNDDKAHYLDFHPTLLLTQTNTGKYDYYDYNLKDIFPVDKSAAILEIGPGTGEGLKLLRDKYSYKNIAAIDNSSGVIEHCIKDGHSNCKMVFDTVDYLREFKDTYDLILMVHVLEHFDHDSLLPLINACYDSLKSGGCLALIVPNIASPLVGVEQHFFDITHRTPFSPWSLVQLFSYSKFGTASVSNCWPGGKSFLKKTQRILQYCFFKTISSFLNIFGRIDRSVFTHSIRVVAAKN